MDNVLEIYTLGQFMIKRNKDSLLEAEKTNDKPWILFKYLISNRGRNIHPEVIMENLFPEMDFSDPKHALTNLVYRLRKLLIPEDFKSTIPYINSSQGGYGFNINSKFWLDVEEFENLCQQAYNNIETAPQQAIDIYRNAFNIYKGDYLMELPYDNWVISFRNNYHWLYTESILQQIELLKQFNKNSEIITLCRTAFQIEPLEEKIHLGYLEALLEEGKTAQARAHYEYASTLFYRELEIRPLPAMQDLYKKIHGETSEDSEGILNIQEQLKNRQKVDGAFFCEPDIFRMLYKLEERKRERNHIPAIICSLTFKGNDDINSKMEFMANALKNNLRKGDIITRWNKNQYLILLPGLSIEGANKVISRIIGGLKNVGETVLESEYHAI